MLLVFNSTTEEHVCSVSTKKVSASKTDFSQRQSCLAGTFWSNRLIYLYIFLGYAFLLNTLSDIQC